jgi:curved DNA-binding protein CbpA
MKHDRRNHYRVLHVQPEAPAQLIAAAYRCLMSTLKHHPDLGGDHETAVRINEAYAVLSDPARRLAYDIHLRQQRQGYRSEQVPRRSAARTDSTTAAASAAAANGCPYCESPLPRIIAKATRCTRCDSPLTPLAASFQLLREKTGRRTAARVRKNEPATIYLGLDQRPSSARMRDLSQSGISFFTAASIATNAKVRICTDTLDVVAQVVQVRTRDRIQLVHARMLTAQFSAGPGVFVSVAV